MKTSNRTWLWLWNVRVSMSDESSCQEPQACHNCVQVGTCWFANGWCHRSCSWFLSCLVVQACGGSEVSIVHCRKEENKEWTHAAVGKLFGGKSFSNPMSQQYIIHRSRGHKPNMSDKIWGCLVTSCWCWKCKVRLISTSLSLAALHAHTHFWKDSMHRFMKTLQRTGLDFHWCRFPVTNSTLQC